ncbi:MAG: protein translocase subunit SecF [Candidatus Planktophila sp.]|nr:protein translocase subunit SecF [Candidatus Planktophila sp.]
MSSLSGIGGRLYRGETSFDFIGKRRRWYAVSGLLIIASIGALAIQGLHLGIEFKGGSSYIVTKQGVTVEQARAAVESTGISGETIIQKIGTEKIRVQTGALTTVESNALEDALATKLGVSVASIDTQIIGPSWGKEITRKALYGLIGFVIVVMLYLAMAFEPKMAIAAIIAVVHDVFITVGIYALVGFDVTPATVIGFLTILGYSLYDTVVVFDKVRENTRTITSTSKSTYSQAANLAVNQTLVRSFNTSLIALIPVGSILFVGAGLLGAGTLKDLSLALFIGLATGTYSSIFIATPILAVLREREPAMQALAKRVNARGGAAPSTEGSSALAGSTGSTLVTERRGPRNQPKRKGRK